MLDRMANGGSGGVAVGDVIGSYRVDAVLGEGAVGTVFRATHVEDGTVVALKVLKARLGADETYRRRFAHEARAAQEVQHKHLVPILEAGEWDGRSFLAVAFIAGRTLEARLEDGPLPLDEILRLAAGVGSGLDALHAKGLIHRDVKPSNIMLNEEGSSLLTDFGLAKGPAYTVLTRPGQVVGTLDYLAPELIKGEDASPASDLYALGCVVYESVTGQPPFAGKGVLEIGIAHLEEEPPDPLANRPDLPAGLAWALKQALAKSPAERPPTASAYANMLSVSARPIR
ncbi:MAG TPA: serine/threonine-protein kinase [Actinomycetota bacterium]